MNSTLSDQAAAMQLDPNALLAAFRVNHHPDAEPSSVELAALSRSIRAYLEAAPSPSPAPGVVRNALAAKAEASGLLSVEDIDEVFAKLRIDPTKSNPVEAALRYARVSILTGTGTVAAIGKIDAALASLAQGGDGGEK